MPVAIDGEFGGTTVFCCDFDKSYTLELQQNHGAQCDFAKFTAGTIFRMLGGPIRSSKRYGGVEWTGEVLGSNSGNNIRDSNLTVKKTIIIEFMIVVCMRFGTKRNGILMWKNIFKE
ncbi:hypothetical protein L195_g014519 [Trifolium pratense]|uniref:Uncharacterized protein n=1 Tax=Trifolium pratense TaxID=57577 RepID=A0A2K3PR70_TRIPR|nr:hypothetical protein L195_g014519 [Trifolium pratense]